MGRDAEVQRCRYHGDGCSRGAGAKEMQRWCRGAQITDAGATKSCRGAEMQQWCRVRYSDAELLQRCRGAEVQRCYGAKKLGMQRCIGAMV